MASSPRRASMWTRRVDQRWFSRGSTPTISRIGLLAGSVPCRSANRTLSVAKLLLQRGVVSLRRRHVGLEQHTPIDGQPPAVEGLDLVGYRDVGVQIRVTGPAVPVGERGSNETSDVDLPDALWPDSGEQSMLLNELSASCTATSWAFSITAANAGSATAHKLDTDFTGENVRSYPATVCGRGRESFAICPARSRAS